MPRDGSYGFSSKTDPRWNCSGRGWGTTLGMIPEAQDHLDRLKATLGEPPDDLEYWFMKD